MGEWISLICVLLTANVDTVLLAMGWSLRRRQFTLGAVAVIGVVTTAATWLALTLGHWAAGCLAALTAKKAGGGLLIAMGVWMMIDALREEPPKTTPVPVGWGEGLPVGRHDLSLAHRQNMRPRRGAPQRRASQDRRRLGWQQRLGGSFVQLRHHRSGDLPRRCAGTLRPAGVAVPVWSDALRRCLSAVGGGGAVDLKTT